ncbi:MAG: single-stranded DNA-binding protein [Acidobacteria bacterium]|nr:single-stranded DNA-binding protein [Acidobacteriota bacterium]
MADNDNIITVVGRIGQEPELRATSKGDVLNFTLATSERKRGADDTWSDGPTSWFRVSAWNDLARNAHASFHKGQLVIVRGVLTIREFQSETGGRSRNAELRASALGHDLRWGTSTYADAGRRNAAQVPSAPPAAPAEPESSDGWGARPGDDDRRETVPAGAAAHWGSEVEAEDAPF